MYTEDDDDDIVIKDDNSNENFLDFYTSFSDNDGNNKKNNKNNKKNKKEKIIKEDNSISEFYEIDSEINEKDNKSKKVIIFAIVFGLLLVLAIILTIIFLGKKDNKTPDIKIMNDNIKINVGEKEIISYQIINSNEDIKATFKSSNTNVLTISENGEIIGIDDGQAEVIVSYTISNVKKEKKCKVTVIGDGKVDKKITLNVEIVNGKDNVWTNKDVDIKVEANSIYGIESLKYTFNCEGSKCDYKDVKNNRILVTNNGTTKVLIIAIDKNKEQEEKTVTIKIDKVPPTINFTNTGNITSNKETTVCATCKDALSGCKQENVCKKFTSSKMKQKIIVEDKAGNQTSSSEFNVVITKNEQPCTLSVSSDGVVSAKLNSDAIYYGFSDSYSGVNQLSKKININISKNGESGAEVIYYYVKNKNGTGGKCFITVIKECNCTNTNINSDNCPVTCKYSSR